MRVPLPFSRNRPENHSHNLGKALGEGLCLLCAPFSLCIPFTSLSLSPLYPFHLSLSFSYLSLPLYISPSTFLFLYFFSLSFSLAYLMDVFVLVYVMPYNPKNPLFYNPLKPYISFSKSGFKNIFQDCWLSFFVVL